ncbi:MAG: RnfH family protein [Legionella sp.]|nr:RnfH family protein [Legionella sp.]
MPVIEVVYVSSSNQAVWHTKHDFQEGMTVRDALILSGVFKLYPEALALPVGVFSKLVGQNKKLQAGDRVELYRPLVFDPKETRRKRVKKA